MKTIWKAVQKIIFLFACAFNFSHFFPPNASKNVSKFEFPIRVNKIRRWIVYLIVLQVRWREIRRSQLLSRRTKNVTNFGSSEWGEKRNKGKTHQISGLLSVVWTSDLLHFRCASLPSKIIVSFTNLLFRWQEIDQRNCILSSYLRVEDSFVVSSWPLYGISLCEYEKWRIMDRFIRHFIAWLLPN